MEDISDEIFGNESVDDLLSKINQLFDLDLGTIPTPEVLPPVAFEVNVEELEAAGFSPAQINEISLGAADHLRVNEYAKPCYNWMQMRELRLGLSMGLDIYVYADPYFNASAMREIRLGLLAGIDVTSYASLMYSLSDMKNMRIDLTAKAYKKKAEGYMRVFTNSDYGLTLQLSDDCMEALLILPDELPTPRPSTSALLTDVETMLQLDGICYGINRQNLSKFLTDFKPHSEYVIATGKPPSPGKAGFYETFFDRDFPKPPKELPNGRVDFTQMNVAESVSPGQRLAHYHGAERGVAGVTVTHIPVEGMLGTELLPLTFSGVSYREETHDYYAAQKGQVYFDEKTLVLNVRTAFLVDTDINRYNGRLRYDGAIIVHGDVKEGSELEASGDIVVNGHVEGAILSSKQNIVIRGGMNAGGNGCVTASGHVIGDFFEATTIQAGGSVEANYFLNCKITTDDKIIAKGSKSRIIGGTLSSVLGIEAKLIAPSGNSKMSLDVGNLYLLDKRITSTQGKIAEINYEIESLSTGKQKLLSMFGDNAEKNTLFQQTLIAIDQKEDELLRYQREEEFLVSLKNRAIFANVRANGVLQAVVYVTINCKTKKILEDVPRALLTAQNIKGDQNNEKK